MTRYIPLPQTLAVITTNRCNATCDHCISASSPERAETLTFAQIRKAVDEVNAINRLLNVTFSGGEPTLLGDELLESIAYCSDMGISTRVVTNGKWAKSPQVAARKIRELREVGLAELNVSCDDYHLRDIPIERVKYAWDAAHGQGFKAVVLANASGVGAKITPDFLESYLEGPIHRCYDESGLRLPLPEPASDGTLYLLSNSTLNLLGRGTELIPVERVKKRSLAQFQGYCDLAWRDMAITPSGEIGSCCGCEIDRNPVLRAGRLEDGVLEALQRADDNVLIAAISVLGPSYLKQVVEAARPDIRFRDCYSNACEICEEVTSRADVLEALRELRPQIAHAIARVAPNGRMDLAAQGYQPAVTRQM